MISFWKEHCEFESTPESVNSIIEAVRALGDRLEQHLKVKLGAVSESAIDQSDKEEILALVEAANAAVHSANAQIKTINSIIDKKKASIGETDLSAETAELSQQRLRRDRHGGSLA